MSKAVPHSATAVIGAGSWGTALACVLSRNGVATTLWGRNAEQVARMQNMRCNTQYLPNIAFPDALKLNSNLEETVSNNRDILIAVPSHAFRQTLAQIAPYLDDHARLIWATKGFESETGKLLHVVVEEVLGKQYPAAMVSGPTFAAEAARGMPTAITLASTDQNVANDIAKQFHNDNFRVYTSNDITGVEVGGSVKNVLAIAAGISDALGFGANARAALITRGLTEVMRLGVALGGQRETIMGLSGLGDLILTCTDDQSRNRRFGLALGRGDSVDTAMGGIHQVVEGAFAAEEVVQLATSLGIEMPISEQVHRVISGQCTPKQAVSELLHREQKPELA